MATFVYPNNRELIQIAPDKVARITLPRLGFDLMPLRPVNAHFIEYQQKDNYQGLQQLRGLDGGPALVKRVGQKRYVFEPGAYGEYIQIQESELTKRAGGLPMEALMGVPIDISDLVLDAQDQLLVRELDLIEYIIWTLLTTGTVTITQGSGSQLSYTQTFSLQTYAATAWSNSATATPLTDIRTAALKGRGKGVSFGSQAAIYMNRAQANALLNNVNNNDIGGRKAQFGSTFNDLDAINKLLLANDLPPMIIYDEGYIDSSGTFQLFIPLGKAILVGYRVDGSKVGEYRLTRNANNPGMAPGSYQKVIDNTGGAKIPANIEIHRGHGGGPVMFFPSAVVIISC